MNEMQNVNNATVIAAEINQIKRQTAQVCLTASIEIGRLLTNAKAVVPHGEWGSWLQENVDYSQSTANNLMRLFTEYGNEGQLDFFSENRLELFGDLSPSKALALIVLPMEQRMEFVRQNDVGEMSVRDLQEAIRRAETAEEETERVQGEYERAMQEAKMARETLERQRKAYDDLLELFEAAKSEAEAPAEVSEADREVIRKEIEDEYQKKLTDSEESHKKELDRQQKQKEKALEEERKKAKADQAAEVDVLKGKLTAAEERIREAQQREEKALQKAKAEANADAQILNVHFELLQREINEVTACMGRMTDNPDLPKYKAAISAALIRCAELLEAEI